MLLYTMCCARVGVCRAGKVAKVCGCQTDHNCGGRRSCLLMDAACMRTLAIMDTWVHRDHACVRADACQAQFPSTHPWAVPMCARIQWQVQAQHPPPRVTRNTQQHTSTHFHKPNTRVKTAGGTTFIPGVPEVTGSTWEAPRLAILPAGTSAGAEWAGRPHARIKAGRVGSYILWCALVSSGWLTLQRTSRVHAQVV